MLNTALTNAKRVNVISNQELASGEQALFIQQGSGLSGNVCRQRTRWT